MNRKNLGKQVLSLFLAAVFLLSTASVALAASKDMLTFKLCYDGTYYSVDSCDEYTEGAVVIPSEYNGKPVKEIGEYAFGDCSITSVTIPDSITTIGESAFSYCGNLTEIYIPQSVTSIGAGAFYMCLSLSGIDVATENPAFASVNGVLFNKDKTVLLAYPSCGAARYTVPDGVLGIGEYAFANNEVLTEVTFPESIALIGEFAFVECVGLEKVTINSSGATVIENRAFLYCYLLASVSLGEGVTEIGEGAFDLCISLEDIVFPSSLQVIGDVAFCGCSLTAVTIPDGVKSIGDLAFDYCDGLEKITVSAGNMHYSSDEFGVLFNKDKTELISYPEGSPETSYTIPDSVKNIAVGAFSVCYNLAEIAIPASVTFIGEGAFNECISLESVIIPNGVTKIEDYAFNYCISLKSVEIPDSVTEIGECSFASCVSLAGIVLPESVTKISYGAFMECPGLVYLHISAKNIEIEDYILSDECRTKICSKYLDGDAFAYASANSVGFSLCPGHNGFTDFFVNILSRIYVALYNFIVGLGFWL